MGMNITRRLNETIVIGGNIIVRIHEVRGDVVNVHVEAPRSLSIDRGEIFDRKQREPRGVPESRPRHAPAWTSAQKIQRLIDQGVPAGDAREIVYGPHPARKRSGPAPALETSKRTLTLGGAAVAVKVRTA